MRDPLRLTDVTIGALQQRLQLLEGTLAVKQLQLDKLREENDELRKENILLKHELELMRDHRFGDRSEKRPDPKPASKPTASSDNTQATPKPVADSVKANSMPLM